MITEIHQSSLNMALRCGEQFRRRYIDNDIIPPGVAAGRGTGVHKANEINLKQKIVTQKDMSLEDLQDAARDAYIQTFNNGVYVPKDMLSEKKKLINIGLNDTLRCTKVYIDNVAPIIKPIEIEKEFKLDVVGLELQLAGRMDYQEAPVVGDLKTTTMKWQQDRIKNEIQVPFYSYVHRQETGINPTFRYDVLIARRNKANEPTSEEYQPLEYLCSETDYKALFAKIKTFINLLKAGVFPPSNPTNWWCGSDKWCGYYWTCPYMGFDSPKRWI